MSEAVNYNEHEVQRLYEHRLREQNHHLVNSTHRKRLMHAGISPLHEGLMQHEDFGGSFWAGVNYPPSPPMNTGGIGE